MGYFFNVIYGDYDRVNELHYYNGIKKNEDEKFEGIKLVLSNIGINNIRKCTLDSISENPNEDYFYIEDLPLWLKVTNHGYKLS